MEIVTESAAMKRVAELIERVAATEANILVLGESGTGKDLVARQLHDRSLRRGSAYVSIDCASLPEELLESELFGYEKGAFTGAAETKPARVEAASGGTLELGEVAHLRSSSQAKRLPPIHARRLQ